MTSWPDDKIGAVALRYIRSASMVPAEWRFTRLGEWDPRIEYEFHADEQPLVTIYVSPTSWSVFTSRRIVGALGVDTVDISPLDVLADEWGDDPKGVGGRPTGVLTLRLRGGKSVRLEFETGKAWMAPIYALRFWSVKYPVLDNLVG